jgi:predicted dehydrogenase
MDAKSKQGLNRRQFIQGAAVAAVAARATAASGTKSPNAKLGVGIIGCGGRAGSHLGVIQEMAKKDKTVEVVALCDVYRPKLERMGKRAGNNPNLYMDYRELLADPKVDVVTIATPDHHHGIQAIDAVKAGKHVYCEKPVTHWRQFHVIKELAQVVADSECCFQLGTQGMSDAAWHQMRAMVKGGVIGQPIHAECGFFRTGDWGERGMPIDDPNVKPGKDLDWEAFLGDSPKRDFDVSRFFRWRMYEDYAGGPVTDLFPHSLTPVTSILGVGMPNRVVATGGMFRYTEREVPDTFNMLIDYPEKITISLTGTQGNNYQGTGHRGSGQKIPIIRGWDGSLTIKDDKIVYIPTDETSKAGRKEERFDIEHGENMLYHMRNLIHCAETGNRKSNSPVDLAYHTQTALIMAMASLRESKVATFDTAKEEIVLV